MKYAEFQSDIPVEYCRNPLLQLAEVIPYGEGRNRGASVSYGEIERAARHHGGRPTVEGVHKALWRGSPNHISVEMQKFWRNQSALNGGDPLAITRLPPELADAAVAQWEQALRLAHQSATYGENAARAHLEQLRRDTDAHWPPTNPSRCLSQPVT